MARFMRTGSSFHSLASGFTLIELMIVMAVLALLGSIVFPRYTDKVDTAREVVLRQNLVGLRSAIDQFFHDKARYPEDLQELVSERYIRAIPLDPITQRFDTWILLPPKDGSNVVFDVRSGTKQRAKDGSEYAQW